MPATRPGSPMLWLRAASVHLYTASGAVLALLIVLAAIDGDEVRALWFGLAALIVDGTDGMLARKFEVKQRLPWFDGARLDDIVDYLTYVFAPVVLLLQGGYLPSGNIGIVVAAIPLLASCLQFCRTDAKTDDHMFLGFPSYWNVVAFYVVTAKLGPDVVAAVLVGCAILVPIPLGYVYPSRTVAFRRVTLAFTSLWLVCYAVILLQMPHPQPLWMGLSLLYVGYYLALSVYLETRRRVARHRSPVSPPTPVLVDD